MKTDSHEPTPEMLAYFERRMADHIGRVRRFITLLADITVHGPELIERAKVHDASKFGTEERIPYVWRNEYLRRRRNGEQYEYPEGIAELVHRGLQHHFRSNRHHPEFHADPNDMTDVDLIEMVCDWTAVSEELGQDGGSARGWADRTIGPRFAFNADKRRFIYWVIAELDRRIAASTKESSRNCLESRNSQPTASRTGKAPVIG